MQSDIRKEKIGRIPRGSSAQSDQTTNGPTVPGDTHQATVIQTQTPINSWNSGGPLLSDDGKIVGVNTFIKTGAEGLNFAVAAEEIRFFLEKRR